MERPRAYRGGMKPTPLPRRPLQGLATVCALLALAGCDRIAIALNPPLLPSATAVASELSLAPGQTRAIDVDVCPPQRYTTDVGYVSVAADVSLSVGGLPRGVQARWDRDRFQPVDFGLPVLCQTTVLHLQAAADAELASVQPLELRASSPFNDNEVHATVLRLVPGTPAPMPTPPPTPAGCSALAGRSWQPLGSGLLAASPELELGGVQLARHGSRVLAAWWEREHLPERFFVRTRQHEGIAWSVLGNAAANAGDDSHVEHLQLWTAQAPAAPAAEAWLAYASSSGFGLGHPAQVVARRLGADDRFQAAAPALEIGSPQTLRLGRSRHGLYAASVARGDSRLRLWRTDPDLPAPAWAAVSLPATLADTTVRKVDFATDRDGSALLALNRIDRDSGQFVERLQLWHLGTDADPAAMSPAAPDHEIRRYVSFAGPGTGAHTLLLLRDAAAPAAQATVMAWFTGDGTQAFGLVARADGPGSWTPLGDLAGFTQAEAVGSFVRSPTLVAGCEGRATLAWSDAQSYPIYAVRGLQADPAAALGFSLLGGNVVHGDLGRHSGDAVALLWNGVGGDPLALTLRLDLQTRQQELAVRTLRP